MHNDEPALPPPKVLQGALRKITEQLAAELVRPTDLAPDWSDFEWRLARAVAAVHGISPLLSSRLKWAGPPGWRPFLQAQRAHVANRQRRFQELLSQLDTRAREQELALVGLKGTALHALGLYTAGERPMADIDLLVHPFSFPRFALRMRTSASTQTITSRLSCTSASRRYCLCVRLTSRTRFFRVRRIQG
jgi:hypothetical protein